MCKHSDLVTQLQPQTCVQPLSTTLIPWWRKWSGKEENLIFTWFAEGSATFPSQPIPWMLLQTKIFILYGEDGQKENRRLCKGKDTYCRVTAIPWQNSPRGQAGVFAMWTSPPGLRSSAGAHVTALYYGGCNEKGWKQCLNPCPDWELLVGTDLFYHNIACVTRSGNASQVVVVLEPQKLIAESLQ